MGNDSELSPVSVPSASSVPTFRVGLVTAPLAPSCPSRWALVKRTVLLAGGECPGWRTVQFHKFDEV